MKAFQPLLSATVTDAGLENLKYPVLISPKLDGIRAVKRGGVILSRKLKPIRNRHVQQLFADLPDNLDGELIVGDPCAPGWFQGTAEGVMSADGEPAVRFYAFDYIIPDAPFYWRFAKLGQCASTARFLGLVNFEIVPHAQAADATAVRELEERYVSQGYEGVMIRSLNGPYKFGRSTFKEGTLLKLKRWQDAEYEVIGFLEQNHNENELETDERGYAKRSKAKDGLVGAGKVGKVLVRSVENHGHVGKVGNGFTDAERIDMWQNQDRYMGRVMTVKFQGFTPYMELRFPSFKGWREPGT